MPALAVTGTGKFGWGSLLASGGFDFITSASGTTAAAISVDNCFSARYDHYLVMRNLLGSSANQQMGVRLRVSSTDASGADYRQQYLAASGATVSGARATGQTSWTYGLGWTEAASLGFSRLWISNPFATVRTTAWVDAMYLPTGNLEGWSLAQEHDLTTSYTGLSVIPAAGTITGTIYVYGLVV